MNRTTCITRFYFNRKNPYCRSSSILQLNTFHVFISLLICTVNIWSNPFSDNLPLAIFFILRNWKTSVHVYITRIRSYLVNSCRSPPLLSWNLDKGPTIYKANTVNLLRIKTAHRLDPISFTLSGKNADGINTTPIYLLEKISHKQS